MLDERPNIFIRGKPIFSSRRMLHKNYTARAQLRRKISGHESQGADAKTN
jgi:hypothetical protein